MAFQDVTDKSKVKVRPQAIRKGISTGCIVTIPADLKRESGLEFDDVVKCTVIAPGKIMFSRIEKKED